MKATDYRASLELFKNLNGTRGIASNLELVV